MKIPLPNDLIVTILTPAIKFWIQTQVEKVAVLELKIQGSDRQILRGRVPNVSLIASEAIYQGLYLSQIELTATEININLAQVLRGKPLRLLAPLPLAGGLHLQESDLQASLVSPLLVSGLNDLLSLMIEQSQPNTEEETPTPYNINWQQIYLETDKFVLAGTLSFPNGNSHSLLIRSGLAITEGHKLLLKPIVIEGFEDCSDRFPTYIPSLEIDLGDRVEISELSLGDRELKCQGRLVCLPE